MVGKAKESRKEEDRRRMVPRLVPQKAVAGVARLTVVLPYPR